MKRILRLDEPRWTGATQQDVDREIGLILYEMLLAGGGAHVVSSHTIARRISLPVPGYEIEVVFDSRHWTGLPRMSPEARERPSPMYHKVPFVPLWWRSSRWPWQRGYDWRGQVSPTAPLNAGGARFGGGWRWCLGIEIGGSTVVLNFLYGIVTVTTNDPAVEATKWDALREDIRKWGERRAARERDERESEIARAAERLLREREAAGGGCLDAETKKHANQLREDGEPW